MLAYRELARERPTRRMSGAARGPAGGAGPGRDGARRQATWMPSWPSPARFSFCCARAWRRCWSWPAMFAFLGKAGRREAYRYVHIGWAARWLPGVVTWAIAAYADHHQRARRGNSARASPPCWRPAILFYIGFWMHDKAHADRWQAYIRQQLGRCGQLGLAAGIPGRSSWCTARCSRPSCSTRRCGCRPRRPARAWCWSGRSCGAAGAGGSQLGLGCA